MENLRHACTLFLLALVLLTFNFGPSIYQSSDDVLSMACALMSYSLGVLLCAWRFGFCRPRHDSSNSRLRYQCMKAAILCLASALAVLLAYKLVRLAPRGTPMVLLVAGAGAAALGIGGCCALLLHRDDWSKQQPYEQVILPPAQELPSHACATLTV